MRLNLTIIAYKNQPPATPSTTVIDENGGSIGRAASNNCVLPDPERFISSKHAAISFQNQQFIITDTSTNGLYINDGSQPLGRDNSAVLTDGQRLLIGDYVIDVNIEEEQLSMSGSPFGETSAPAASIPSIEDDFLTPLQKESTDFPGMEDTGPIPPPFPAAPPVPFGKGLNDQEQLPENNDFFAPSGGMESRPLIPDFDGASEADNVPAENQFFQPPRSMPEGGTVPAGGDAFQPSQSIPDDWDIMEDLPPPAPPAAPPPPQPVAPQPAAAPPLQPAPTAPPSGGNPDALKILLRGANMEHLDIPPEKTDATLETIGMLLRTMVSGMMEVLRARAEIKSEFRMQLTTIRPVENNPLKFSVNVDDALRHMLAPESDAYLPPREALNEAMDNIEAHQLAVMAGMQAALSSMLERFEPGTLERYFEGKGGRSLLESKKSWYWEQFEEKYKEVLTEAEDNFQELFGEEFARAYQEQTRKLAQARNLAEKNEG